MRVTAVFTQGAQEIKRYLLDYTLNLAVGETVTAVPAPTITTPQGQSDANSPTLTVTGIVIGPGNLVVAYFVQGGVAGGTYYVNFLTTTSLTQVLEDVVQYNIQSFNT